MFCFEWNTESTGDSEGGQQALVVSKDTSKLWPKGSVLKVYFSNIQDLDSMMYEGLDITRDTIIKWMNEWRSGANSPVPKFEKTRNIDGSDIRVQFTG